MFRRAVWNYIHCMYGIRHDDYNYGEVNQMLERNLKAYIKTVTCYPERLTKKDYDNVMREFKHSEKVSCATDNRAPDKGAYFKKEKVLIFVLILFKNIFFLFLFENICCRYSLEVPHQGSSN